MKIKLPLSFARLLRTLVEGELAYAEFTAGNRKLLEQFIKDDVLDYRLIGKQQKKIFCPDAGNLARYLQNKFEIPALGGYIDFLEQEDFQRSDAVRAASDSKLRKAKVFAGLLLNCYDELACKLHSANFSIKPVKGAFTFVSAYKSFEIPPDVTVIIVEGHENFRAIDRQRNLFEGLKPLFVWRYQNSNTIVEWLNSLPNPYIHFGDFDLKGIHIYLAEFKNKIPGNRGQFLIPADLETLLILHGEKDLYEKQKTLLPSIRAQQHHHSLIPLMDLICKHKKGLVQEIFIQ